MGQFNIGDTVVLKSGGPILTIIEVGGAPTDWVTCSWYEGKKFNTQPFPPAALRLADDSDTEIGVA
jgi:uncharacterized protein YodC (DUF2158 family)